MPMGRWRGQSLADRQLGDGHKDPSAVGIILSHFPEHVHNTGAHDGLVPLCVRELRSVSASVCV